jgi:hypothetical protein
VARGLPAAAVAAVLLAAPCLSPAATICVAQEASGCDSSFSEVQPALDYAREAPGDDRVAIGPGRFEGPFSYSPGGAGGQIEVVGQGPATILTAPPPTASGATILDLDDGDGSAVSGLTVRIPARAGPAADSGIRADAVTGVRVSSDAEEASPSPPSVGVRLPTAGGSLRNSVVELVGGGGGEVGVLVEGGSASTPTTVSDVRITAPVAVRSSAQATSVVRARILTEKLGVLACNAPVTVEDTLVRVVEGVGLRAEGGEECGSGQGALTVRQVTIAGTGAGAGAVGAEAVAGASGQAPRVDVSLSIVRGVQTAFRTAANAPGTAPDTRVGASDFEAARHAEVGAQGTPTFEMTEPDIDADPLFTAELLGDFTLRPGSPAIDSAFSPPLAAGESATDLSGNPRVVDGNGDGVAARDMGAFEAPAQPQVVPPDTVPPQTLILRRRRRGKHPPRAGRHGFLLKVPFASSEAGSTFECRLDAGRFHPCASPYRKRVSAGVHRLEVRAIDPAGNVDPTPARMRLRIAAPPRRHHRHHRRHARHAHRRHARHRAL